MTTPIAVIHLDESCLGNGKEGANPGGAGGIIELRHGGEIERRDFWLSSPDTTNNRMALAGASALLRILAAKGHRFRLLGMALILAEVYGQAADANAAPPRFGS